MTRALPLIALALIGCATINRAPPRDPQAAFFKRLQAWCAPGAQAAGRMLTSQPADAAFAGQALVARGAGCDRDTVRIAFDVGTDRSRTWIVTRTAGGLRLKHRHLLKDGSVDPVSNYGGDTVAAGTADQQEFPADAESRTMFEREGRAASVTNVWAIEANADGTLVYELSRPGRLFRVGFAAPQASAGRSGSATD